VQEVYFKYGEENRRNAHDDIQLSNPISLQSSTRSQLLSTVAPMQKSVILMRKKMSTNQNQSLLRTSTTCTQSSTTEIDEPFPQTVVDLEKIFTVIPSVTLTQPIIRTSVCVDATASFRPAVASYTDSKPFHQTLSTSVPSIPTTYSRQVRKTAVREKNVIDGSSSYGIGVGDRPSVAAEPSTVAASAATTKSYFTAPPAAVVRLNRTVGTSSYT